MEIETPIQSRPDGSRIKVKLMGMLILVISTGFVWMSTSQVIAPPILRTADVLWRLFVCRCFFQFDLLH
jgi:hypothetical protein